MRRTLLVVALGMGLMSALCACGNRENVGSTMETIGSGSDEADIGYQSERNSSQINQTEQEEAMAEEGYVTVCFDFCGGDWASRSDGELLDMSVLTEKADLEAVLEEVKQWDFVDTGSIYLMGNSQGGLVTALTAAEHKEEIRAVILIYPAFCIYDDVHEMFDSPEEIPETHSLLGLRLGNRYFVDIWDQEPYERIREYGKNILLIHGDRDSIVPISYSDKLAETIDHVEYHVIRGADHGYLGEDFELAVSYIRDFLNAEQGAAQE